MIMRSKMRLAMLTLRIMKRSDLDIDCRDSIIDMMQTAECELRISFLCREQEWPVSFS